MCVIRCGYAKKNKTGKCYPSFKTVWKWAESSYLNVPILHVLNVPCPLVEIEIERSNQNFKIKYLLYQRQHLFCLATQNSFSIELNANAVDGTRLKMYRRYFTITQWLVFLLFFKWVDRNIRATFAYHLKQTMLNFCFKCNYFVFLSKVL